MTATIVMRRSSVEAWWMMVVGHKWKDARIPAGIIARFLADPRRIFVHGYKSGGSSQQIVTSW